MIDFRAGAIAAFATFALLRAEALGGFQIDAAEGLVILRRQHLGNGLFVFLGEVGVLVELGFEPLDFLEVIDEGGAGLVAFEIRHGFRGAIETLGFHEAVQLLHRIFQFLDDDRGLVHEPDFAGLVAGLFPGEEGDGGIDGVLLLAEVEDIAVGLGAVEHAVGAGECLNQAVVLELLVHVERVQEFGIEAG